MSASEAQVLTGQHPFAKHYVHASMVSWQGHKMSKSRGNLVFVSTLRHDGVDPMAIRLALIAHHYRSPWSWSEQGLEGAVTRLQAWRSAARQEAGPASQPVIDRMRDALYNDLRTPEALDAIDDWAVKVARGDASEPGGPSAVGAAVDALLGVDLR